MAIKTYYIRIASFGVIVIHGLNQICYSVHAVSHMIYVEQLARRNVLEYSDTFLGKYFAIQYGSIRPYNSRTMSQCLRNVNLNHFEWYDDERMMRISLFNKRNTLTTISSLRRYCADCEFVYIVPLRLLFTFGKITHYTRTLTHKSWT